jgi:hypothetical protein
MYNETVKRFWFALLSIILLLPSCVWAADDFKLTLSPVFLNAATDPGKLVTSNVKVTNGGAQEERLTIGVMKFRAFDDSGRPELLEMEPNDVYAQWISFSPPELVLAPGRSEQVAVTFAPPAEAALGYYYAITFRRAGAPAAPTGQETQLLGTAAILALLEVNSPDTARQLAAVEFSTDRRWYDFLPVKFNVKLQNTGNIHLAPRGNIFIDKGAKTDLAILDINKAYGNILPGADRSFSTDWVAGFPVRTDGELKWNFNDLSKLRWGKYTAHLVMVYDNGQQDVPVEAAVSFWVIPWQIIVALLVIVLLLLLGVRSFFKGLRARFRRQPKSLQP